MAASSTRTPGRSATGPTPWPVRRGGLVLKLYEHSLSSALFLFFLLSFAGHALGEHAEYNTQQLGHGQPPVSLWTFLRSSEFWFQSLQNWQSEFLAVAVLVVFSIFLRERGSPESKAGGRAAPRDRHRVASPAGRRPSRIWGTGKAKIGTPRM